MTEDAEAKVPDPVQLEADINARLIELHKLEVEILADAGRCPNHRVHTCPTCKVKGVDLQGRNCPRGWKRVQTGAGTVDYYCPRCTPGAESLAEYYRRNQWQMGM